MQPVGAEDPYPAIWELTLASEEHRTLTLTFIQSVDAGAFVLWEAALSGLAAWDECGLADTREDLIFLKEKLGEDGCFSDIDLPLSNLVDKNNIEFQIVFKIKSDCLKKK